MNPQEEARLTEEVIYLHSLWHQGPPSPNPLHIASTPPIYIPHYQQYPINPIPTHPFAPTHSRLLPPTNTTTCNKRNLNNNNKSKKKRRKKDPTNNITQPNPPQSPGPEWPCLGSPDPPQVAWPSLKPCLVTPAVSVSPQEKERLVALQVQNKACQAFRDFLVNSNDDDDDDVHDEDDDDVGDDGTDELEEFFVKVFMEDDELRGYYQRCSEGGELCCLVCGAIGKKNSRKKFKDCVALVQHSMSISRTVKKRAHRAFGMAVCKVLGWDADRLPTIVMKGEPLGCSKGIKPFEAEGEAKESAADDGKDGPHKSDDKVVSGE